MSPITIASETLIADAAPQNEEAPLLELWLDDPEDNATVPAARPLRELAPGPWRSLGRYLDYTNWPDRERFLELDRAIEANAQLDAIDEASESIPVSHLAWTPEPVFSPALMWGVRPIGGGHYRRYQRRRVN